MLERQLGRARLFSPIDLEILIGLSEGLTQADIGAQLRLEQPAVSKHLRAAEKRVGLPLVHQRGRRLCLTSLGKDVADAAKPVLAQLDGVETLVGSWRAGSTGSVRVIASTTPGSYVLPRVVGEFLRQNPKARIDLDVRPLVQLWSLFINGNYDFAVVPSMQYPVPLKAEPLYEDRVVFFVAPSHRLARKEQVTIDDFQDETLIGKFSEGYWRSVFSRLEHRGLSSARQVELVSLEAIKQLAASGVGVGALFESAIRQELDEGKFHRLPYHQPKLKQTFCLAQRREAVRSPMVERFGSFVLKALAR